MIRARVLLVGVIVLWIEGGASAGILAPQLTWSVNPASGNTVYYFNDNVVDGNVLAGAIGYGPFQQNKGGTVVHSLVTSPTATSKSAVRVGDYVYFTGSSGGVYRTQAANTANPWTTFAAVTVSNSVTLESLATDGTSIYGTRGSLAGDQIYCYTVEPTSGSLTQVWSSSGITGRVRGIDWDPSGYVYAVDGGGSTEAAANNTASLYAISTTNGSTTNMGTVTYNGRLYQTVREGNQIALFDSCNKSGTPSGQMYVYNLANDTTLASTAPVATYDPAGINNIYAAAIDDGFLWLGSYGVSCGYQITPEPSSFLLLGVGSVVYLGYFLRRRWRKS